MIRMHAQGPSCAGRTVGVELRVVQSLRLGPRWVPGCRGITSNSARAPPLS
jgi:hypothetical protein